MTDDEIYRALQKHMDQMPIGYPATKSGVELRILKRFFTPQEAKIALKLSFIPEPFSDIYPELKGLGLSEEEAQDLLNNLLKKGVINGGKHPNTGEMYYAIAFLAIGIYEYQVGRLTKDFVEDFKQYIDEGFKDEITKTKIPQLRTIPIEKSITVENFVATYDDVEHLIMTRKPISKPN